LWRKYGSTLLQCLFRARDEVPVLASVTIWIWSKFGKRNSAKIKGNKVDQSYTPLMGKLSKEGAKGKEKNFRRANIIY